VLFWAFLALVFSGVVLFLAPKGRIANWTDWRLLTLAKEQWAAVHILMAILFLVGGLFHLLKFNRRTIWTYVRRSKEEASPFRWAVIGSVVVFAVVMIGTLSDVQPFAAVIDVNERFRNGLLARTAGSPPTAHLEELTLAQVAERLSLDPADACDTLRRRGLLCDHPGVTLVEIARANTTSPDQIYALLDPAHAAGETRGQHMPGATGGGPGAGWGRLTVADVAAKLGISPEQAVENLRLRGIDAANDDSLRAVADRSGLRPADLPALISPNEP
jgi:hypothetical protein